MAALLIGFLAVVFNYTLVIENERVTIPASSLYLPISIVEGGNEEDA